MQIGNIKIADVRHAPDAEFKLLSVVDLTKSGCNVDFHDDICEVRTDGRIILSAKRSDANGQLYVLGDKQIHLKCALTTTCKEIPRTRTLSNWHRALGHLNTEAILKLEKRKLADGMKIIEKVSVECELCLEGKMARPPQAKVARRIPEEPGDIISMDLVGPFKAGGMSSGNYLSVLVDHFTGYTDVETLLHKDSFNVINHVKKFFKWLETQTKCKVKTVRTDNGNEYCNEELKEYFARKGIIHECTAPYSPAMNGCAERQNRTILEGMKTNLISSRLPQHFWSWAAYWTVFTQNRTLIGPYTGVTPFEGIFRFKPDISKLEPFGSICYVLTENKTGKLEPNAKKGILLGYAGEGVYHVLVGKQLVTSRNVRFLSSNVNTTLDSDFEDFLVTSEDDDGDEDNFLDVPPGFEHLQPPANDLIVPPALEHLQTPVFVDGQSNVPYTDDFASAEEHVDNTDEAHNQNGEIIDYAGEFSGGDDKKLDDKEEAREIDDDDNVSDEITSGSLNVINENHDGAQVHSIPEIISKPPDLNLKR